MHIGGASLGLDERACAAYYESLVYFYRKHYGRLTAAILRRLVWAVWRRVNLRLTRPLTAPRRARIASTTASIARSNDSSTICRADPRHTTP